MKKDILLFGCVIFMHIHLCAQNKELRIEDDGFEWFYVSQNGKSGALNFKGEPLIPVDYDAVTYKPFSSYSDCNNCGGFKVKKGNALGAYNIDGKCIIPTNKNYKDFVKYTTSNLGTYYWVLLHDGRTGICDSEGRERFVTKESGMWIHPVLEEGKFYYRFEINGDGLSGIIDGNGDVIIKPKYFWVCIEDNKFKGYKTEKDADNDKLTTIGSIPNSGNFLNILNGNGRDDAKQMFLKIGFVPLGGKVEKRIDKQDGKTKYFVEKDNLKGVRDLHGKWTVPLCKEYKQINIGGRDYLQVKNDKSQVGLCSINGDIILNMEYDIIEEAGNRYVKVIRNSIYGVLSLDGKEIIPTSRGYTYIGNFDSSKGTFAFTKKGISGVCNAQGREIFTSKLAPTTDDIKANGGYASAVEMKNGSTKYFKVSKGGRYGLTDSEGKEIVPCEMEALESAGTGYLKYKINGFWGVMNYAGKILIDTDRGYTSIGDFKTFNKRFPYTMNGYKGECDINGRQISKIKVETPKQAVASSSSSSLSSSNSSSSSSSSSSSNSGNGTTTVVVEHHRDPVPVQEWQQCPACYGSGQCPYVKCGGSGWYYIGDRASTCSMCHGSGKCSTCAGKGGHYITVYR